MLHAWDTLRPPQPEVQQLQDGRFDVRDAGHDMHCTSRAICPMVSRRAEKQRFLGGKN
jgi:hypothetical protein